MPAYVPGTDSHPGLTLLVALRFELETLYNFNALQVDSKYMLKIEGRRLTRARRERHSVSLFGRSDRGGSCRV